MTQYGNIYPGNDDGDFNDEYIRIRNILMQVNTSMPVIVDAVRGGGLAPVGYLDCTVSVFQLTGDGRTVENMKLTNVPYVRYQGGSSAVIIDPKKGDIGIVCFCQRDISSFKKARKKAPPASRRFLDASDAVYLGGILNATPTQYIHFTDSGIVCHSPTKVTIEAPTSDIISDVINLVTPLVNCSGAFLMTGTLGTGATMRGGLENIGGTIISDGIDLETHVHGGVVSGSDNTGEPE